LDSLEIPEANRLGRVAAIESYLERFRVIDPLPEDSEDYRRLEGIRLRILDLMAEADVTAKRLREARVPQCVIE
jgi:hypothetical protein